MNKMRDILESHRVPIAPHSHHHTRPGWLNIDCPFCGLDSGRYHLGYSEHGRYFNCWRCGAKPLVSTLAALLRCPPAQASQILGALPAQTTQAPMRCGGAFRPPAKVGPLAKIHSKYLRARGLNVEEVAKLWHLAGIGLCGHLSWRIFLPIERFGKPFSWTTRAVSADTKQRYISASAQEESWPAKEWLYGYDFVRNAIIVHEGPFDAIATGPGAVATFGLSYTSAQISMIAEIPTRVICFDSSPDALTRARNLADELSVFPGTTCVVTLDTGKDAGDASKKELAQLRAKFLE